MPPCSGRQDLSTSIWPPGLGVWLCSVGMKKTSYCFQHHLPSLKHYPPPTPNPDVMAREHLKVWSRQAELKSYDYSKPWSWMGCLWVSQTFILRPAPGPPNGVLWAHSHIIPPHLILLRAGAQWSGGATGQQPALLSSLHPTAALLHTEWPRLTG